MTVRDCVSNKVSLLATDEGRIYGDLTDYPHEAVHHAAKQYVVGSYHKVSRKYLPQYVAEFQFRYNNRFNDDIFGTAIKDCRANY